MPERRFKDGVDYWNIDVDFFENKKVWLIRGEFGIKGVYLYILILNEIYRTGGYYKKWDRDDCLLMSDSSGVAGDCSPELIAEVVQGLVRRSLFDKGVLDRFGVLTSAEIQRRFLRIVGNSRDSIPMVQEYFLLEPSNRKDVTRATFSKIAFFSIDSKDSTQNLKDGTKNFKVLDKEKNRKEEKRTEGIGGPPAAPASAPMASETGFGAELQAAFTDWLAYKREKRQGYKATGLRSLTALVKENAAKYGEAAVAALIRQSMASNWQGIIWAKLEEPANKRVPRGIPPGADPQPSTERIEQNSKWLDEFLAEQERGIQSSGQEGPKS